MDSAVRQNIEHEIASKSWEAIRRRLRSLQTDAKHSIFDAHDLNGDGRIFHILCATRDAPSDIIQQMIDLDSTYMTQNSEGDGKTALHYAAETGSAGTVKLLLDQMSKLHQCDASEASGSRSEKRMWVNNCSLAPLASLWRNRLKTNLIWDGTNNDVQSAVELLKQMDKVTCYADMTEELQDLWDKTQLFVHAALSDARQSEEQGHVLPRGEEQRLILHDMVRYGGTEEMSFPREALWLASKLHPHLLQTRDENGDLPLHVALKSQLRFSWSALECCKKSAETYAWDDEDLKSILANFSGCTVVSLLLREFPDAASMKDGSGRLPLQIVCDNLLAERCPVDLTGRDIAALLKAAPRASLATDKEGNAPLHTLCKFICRGNRRKRHSLHPEYVARYAIFHMIKVTPQAAYVRDCSSRLPLHILLNSDDCPVEQPSMLRDMDVLAMVQSAPDALDVPNGTTGLVPFMTAAVGEKFSMDCAYTLLRRNPPNINRGGNIEQQR